MLIPIKIQKLCFTRDWGATLLSEHGFPILGPKMNRVICIHPPSPLILPTSNIKGRPLIFLQLLVPSLRPAPFFGDHTLLSTGRWCRAAEEENGPTAKTTRAWVVVIAWLQTTLLI